MGKGKIQRLESKNYRPRRETRIEKISMKQSDNYTRKEIKAQKLYNKAYNTLGKARGIGGLDPTLFSANKRGRQLDKMGELGAKYGKQVERAQKYHMNLGSKEIDTQGSLRREANIINTDNRNIKIGGALGNFDPLMSELVEEENIEDVGDVGGEIMNIKTGE
tara:strand:- start:51 stop:539 length:489 start_codon:yes stop_codon:yes gene_type:complete